MELIKLGDNLYDLRVPFWTWSSRKILTKAILKLQEEGKIITAVQKCISWIDHYIICTTDKK